MVRNGLLGVYASSRERYSYEGEQGSREASQGSKGVPSIEGSNEGISVLLVNRLGSFVTICLRLSLGFCGKPPDPAFPSPSLALIHFLAS
jgi:hypothetical protein